MLYSRICSGCGHEIFHKTENALYQAIWSKRKCRTCSQTGHIVSDFTKEKMSLLKIGKPLSDSHKKNISKVNSGVNHPMYGKHHTDEMRRKQSIRNKGKKLSSDTKRKLRILSIAQHRKNGVSFPAVDKGATEFFDQLNKISGYHIQHPNIEIKELGYFVDGYDPVLHAVFEYDTKTHNNKKYRNRDLQRQKEIINYYDCKGEPLRHFFRIKSSENKLIDVFINVIKTTSRL